MIKKMISFVMICMLALQMTACSKSDENTVWVYTSMFPETIALYEAGLKAKYPNLKVRWFQNGSENVAAKIALEEVAGDIKADVVLTADIFWFHKKAAEGFWDPYEPKLDYEVPQAFRGQSGTFTTPRISVMALGYNKKFISESDAPKSYKELIDPKWKGKLSSGSPLESGTNYTLMLNLVHKYGYDFLSKLHANDVMAAGGNSAVLKRIVTGERPVGLILEESLLYEQAINPNIGIIYPEDGVIIAPGPMGITKASKNKAGARLVYDFIMSSEGQKLCVQGNLHSPNPAAGFPKNSRPFAELLKNSFSLGDDFFEFAKKEEKSFKDKFADIMFQ